MVDVSQLLQFCPTGRDVLGKERDLFFVVVCKEGRGGRVRGGTKKERLLHCLELDAAADVFAAMLCNGFTCQKKNILLRR